MTLLDQPSHYAAIRKRLLNPQNGRGTSTDLDIVPDWVRRNERIREARQMEAQRKAESEARRRELLDAAIKKAINDRAHARGIAEQLIADDRPLPKLPTVMQILQAVSREFGVPLLDIMSKRRTAAVVIPRQVAMYLARKMTVRSLPEISRQIGGRDHTTALHGVRKIEALLPFDPELEARINEIRTQLSTALVASCVSANPERGEGPRDP